MTRLSSQHFECVVCGKKAIGDVVCMTCSFREKERQRNQIGSVTRKQLSFIENLLSKLDTRTSSEVIYAEIKDYDGELENLTTNQAGNLIAKLLEHVPEESEAK